MFLVRTIKLIFKRRYRERIRKKIVQVQNLR